MADDNDHRRAAAVMFHHSQPVVQMILFSRESGADYDQVDVTLIGQKEAVDTVHFRLAAKVEEPKRTLVILPAMANL